MRHSRPRIQAHAIRCAVVACVVLNLSPAAAAGACDPLFLGRVDLGLVEADALIEASGLAASRRNPGVLWSHNDSGGLNRVFALNEQGQHLGVYTIAGASNRDWEDIAVGPGPDAGRTYLYIGEIGDNDSVYDTKYVYRVPEPQVDCGQAPVDSVLSDAVAIAFQYPDGRRDAETLMVDSLTRDIYVVSKREAAVRVYRGPYPQPVGSVITLEHVATLAMTSIVAGDISPSGREILLKTYAQVFHWCRNEGQTVAEALLAVPTAVPYIAEPQGEAIAWDGDGVDYFTVSEEKPGFEAHLYLYPRDAVSSVDDDGLSGDRGAGDDEGRGVVPSPIFAPNPFRQATEIRYVLDCPTYVTLRLHTLAGRHVRTLVDAWQEAGERATSWDGRDGCGRLMPAGAYYYSLQTEAGTRPGRIVSLR